MYDFVRNPFGLFRGAMEVEALGSPGNGRLHADSQGDDYQYAPLAEGLADRVWWECSQKPFREPPERRFLRYPGKTAKTLELQACCHGWQ